METKNYNILSVVCRNTKSVEEERDARKTGRITTYYNAMAERFRHKEDPKSLQGNELL